jgi:hypothetical protein
MGGSDSVQKRTKAKRDLWHIIAVLEASSSAEEAAALLGISRRSMFYQLKTAPQDTLRRALLRDLRAWVRIANERQRRLETLRHENQALAAENRRLTAALANRWGEDPYAVLGLRRGVPMAVVDAAYKVWARLCHPDHGGTNEAMQRINDAHDRIVGKR